MTLFSLDRIASALAAVAMIFALAGGAQAASHSPGHGSAPTSGTQIKAEWGHGYGRGWCYWHPYACSYRY